MGKEKPPPPLGARAADSAAHGRLLGHREEAAGCRLRGRGRVQTIAPENKGEVRNAVYPPCFSLSLLVSPGKEGLTPLRGRRPPLSPRGPRKWGTAAASRKDLGAERPAWLRAKLARESRLFQSSRNFATGLFAKFSATNYHSRIKPVRDFLINAS